MIKMITNGRCIVPDGSGHFTVKNDTAIIFDERIVAIVPQNYADYMRVAEAIDANGLYVSPGFINVHIHGCGGFDVMDRSSEAIAKVAQFLPNTGVTSFLATTMTMSLERIHLVLRRIRTSIKNRQSLAAKLLGAHLEGPYISPKYKGAQSESDIRRANFKEIADYTDIIKIITIAPEELSKNSHFIEQCQKSGIIVSMGHSAADYDNAMKYINRQNVKHITHICNAQTRLNHRHPGIVGAALETDAMVELISDDIHVHPMIQRLIWKIKAHDQILLITDSMRACGLGDGVYELGGQSVTVRGERALLNDGTIAASIAPMNRVLVKFRNNTGASIPEVVELVTKNPAQELGIYNGTGSLKPGKMADMVIFDENFNIRYTVVNGELCYSADKK